ncbi:MAG TPA: hypothetical protein VIX35_00590, partial [Vicinamibacterales bacterium]
MEDVKKKNQKRRLKTAMTAVVIMTVGLAGACAQPVMTWVPLIGAAGLVFKTTQARKPAAPKPAAAAETTVERTP